MQERKIHNRAHQEMVSHHDYVLRTPLFQKKLDAQKHKEKTEALASALGAAVKLNSEDLSPAVKLYIEDTCVKIHAGRRCTKAIRKRMVNLMGRAIVEKYGEKVMKTPAKEALALIKKVKRPENF